MENSSQRFERKFLVTNLTIPEVGVVIRRNRAGFRQAYPPRYVNNIYFDAPNFSAYRDNVDGTSVRQKYRLRWYGNALNASDRAQFEVKRKRGLVGTKETYKIGGIDFEQLKPTSRLFELIAQGNIPESLRIETDWLAPVLVNQYQRMYLVSADKRVRLTLDTDISFRSVGPDRGIPLLAELEIKVVELKYRSQFDDYATRISNDFPFRMTKSSKYVMGLERVSP